MPPYRMAYSPFRPEEAHYGHVRPPRDHDLDVLTDLALAAQAGDRSALAELSRWLQQPVYRLALRFSGHPSDAEDIALEVMLRLLTTLETYDVRRRLTLWVYANAVRQLLRTEARSAERAATEHPAEADDDSLLRLSRKQRVAYILSDLLGFTVAEGADIGATDQATFYEWLTEARASLRPLALMPDPDGAAPDTVWSRLVATMPTHLGAD
jgi:DNA-directed RNA polymerase specialized sigma24 family protein